MTRPAVLLPTALALVVLAAGCLGLDDGLRSSDDAARTAVQAPGISEDAAMLVLEVTDPAIHPIEGVEATVDTSAGSHRALTDATGIVRIEGLEPGRAIVTLTAADHEDRQLTLDLPGGETTQRSIVLPPSTETHSAVQVFEFHGFFECSATYLIVTGDCLSPVDAAAEQAGIDVEPNATNGRFIFRFPVERGWSKIQVRQTWEDPVAGAGSMMRVNLEPIAPNGTTGHSPQYAETEGQSPIALAVANGQRHANASSEAMLVPEEGGWLRTRSFHLGLAETHHPAGTDFLGVGAAVQQPFTVTVEVHDG